jgi:carbonic anhydrase/acetyltransferase-like protein (isoleucine patch superfamily)
VIGARTSIQDGTIVHTTPFDHTTVGDDCVIGHVVHLEGCIIQNLAQVSSGAIVLHRAIVESGAIVAANAVVLNGMVVPSGSLAVGAPAVIKEGKARQADIEMAVNAYIHKGDRFRAQLRRID